MSGAEVASGVGTTLSIAAQLREMAAPLPDSQVRFELESTAERLESWAGVQDMPEISFREFVERAERESAEWNAKQRPWWQWWRR